MNKIVLIFVALWSLAGLAGERRVEAARRGLVIRECKTSDGWQSVEWEPQVWRKRLELPQ